jgi:protein-tyrosine phosphatase
MLEVATSLYVGTSLEARQVFQKEEWRLANVAKTIHLEIHHWSKPDNKSPYYILHEEEQWVSVNWVDAPRPELFNYQNKGVSVVKKVLVFIQKGLQEDKKVLVSCDQGLSRSPSVAMLYLAKVLHMIPDGSFAEAAREFVKIYPRYQPASGIGMFLAEHWFEF